MCNQGQINKTDRCYTNKTGQIYRACIAITYKFCKTGRSQGIL